MKIGVITDAHLCPPGTPPETWHNPFDFDRAEAHLVAALRLVRNRGADVITLLGDLTHLGDVASMERAFKRCAESDPSILAVSGNHDCGERIERFARLGWSATPRPVRAATAVGERLDGLRFVGLPITDRDPELGWCVDVPAVAAWGREPVIVLSHFPVHSREEAARRADLRYAGTSADRDGFGEAVQTRDGPTIVLHGHLHIRDAVAIGPLLQIGCAALIEPPHEVTEVDVEVGTSSVIVRVRRLPVTASPPVRLPVLTGERGEWAYRDRVWTPIA